MTMLSPLYSAKEAASKLNVTDGRIRQICIASDGRIGKKLGRDWFLTDADLELIRLKTRMWKKSADPDSEDDSA